MDVAQIKMPLPGRLTERVIMVINTNLSALSSSTQLMQSSNKLSASLSRLSSGSKITSPADDSAGLAVSMKLNAQMARIDAATNNVGNAISFNQTQDGYLQKVSDALNRMSEAPSLDGLAHLRPELLQTFSIRHRLRPDGMSNQRQAGFPLRADQAARSSGLNLMAG